MHAPRTLALSRGAFYHLSTDIFTISLFNGPGSKIVPRVNGRFTTHICEKYVHTLRVTKGELGRDKC